MNHNGFVQYALPFFQYHSFWWAFIRFHSFFLFALYAYCCPCFHFNHYNWLLSSVATKAIRTARWVIHCSWDCFQLSRWTDSFPFESRLFFGFNTCKRFREEWCDRLQARRCEKSLYSKHFFLRPTLLLISFIQFCWNCIMFDLLLLFIELYTNLTHTNIGSCEYGTLQSLNWYIIRHFQFHSLLLFSAGLHFTCILIGKLWFFSCVVCCCCCCCVVNSISVNVNDNKRENVKKTYHSWKHTPSTLIFNNIRSLKYDFFCCVGRSFFRFLLKRTATTAITIKSATKNSPST